MEKTRFVILSSNPELLVAFCNTCESMGFPVDTEWNTRMYRKDLPFKAIVIEKEDIRMHNHDCRAGSTTVDFYTLPNQWSEALEATKDMYNKYIGDWKVGDPLTEYQLNHKNTLEYCKDETNGWTEEKSNPYIEDRFIEDIKFINGRWAAKVSDCGGDWWVALDSLPKSISIGDYNVIIEKNRIHIGCQIFTKGEVKFMLRMLQDPINADITIAGTEITIEIMEEILKSMKNA